MTIEIALGELEQIMEACRLLGWRQCRTYFRSKTKTRPRRRIRSVREAMRHYERANGVYRP
ncbi:hypothetical protein [Meiothermus granaticius]|uniref:Uncharacterized protein n=1 Tax=Meiothermus granaticius NBRC 107808 TaxID=1227551 RepID=A0A399FCL4_9DEIN|nr:hypothetical protein [Meiothermus granaticius]RIH93973.1 hypothetical protein Mgrana_00059 [Meiothermus granaticius NBRC 107808]GEM88199.1 hypothetical protein MGR01S_28240 [Meiothermus granaticius NBRC 107808]